mmetsp:Transcript_27165/g.73446  ORF Transcript_27165/g.73446 Transcript_27165/m.73446 type:complete len:229 (+) Transcript_27165:900-1586(+)
MKAERTGALSWDEACALNLGLTEMSAPQRKLMSGMILTKPVSPCDAALAMLGISVVETSTKVTFINSSRPGTKMVQLSNPKARRANISSTFEKYGTRPASLETMTFTDYFKNFQLEKDLPAKLQGTEILQDDLNNFLVPRQGLVRFNDPHPNEDALNAKGVGSCNLNLANIRLCLDAFQCMQQRTFFSTFCCQRSTSGLWISSWMKAWIRTTNSVCLTAMFLQATSLK